MIEKKLLVTGASGYLGQSLALRLANETSSVTLSGKNSLKLTDAQSSIEKIHSDVTTFPCDLSIDPEVYALSRYANSREINFLVYAAGIPCPGKPFVDISPVEIREILSVNLTAPILLCNLVPSIKYIIHLNSMVGLEHKPYRSVYSATKWGMRGFSESLKLEQESYFLDVYLSRVRTRPEYQEGMEVDLVVEKILSAYKSRQTKLIVDGRPKSGQHPANS